MSNEGVGWREELGRALTVLRVAGGLTQHELAKLTGIPSSSISDYERGTMVPGLRILQRLLGGLGLPLVAIQEAQGLVEFVKRARLGASPHTSQGAGEKEATVPSSLALDRLALRREIERVAGNVGKSLAQMVRLTLLALCDQPAAASTLGTTIDPTDRPEAEAV